MSKVSKKIIALVLLLTFVFVCIPVSAAEAPVVYKSTITVTKDGGQYQVGFVDIEFKKDFLDRKKLPIKIKVEISAKDGVPGIEFSPDIPDFNKAVHVKVNKYKGLLYNPDIRKNIKVDIKKQQLILDHFSRYAFS